MLECRIINGHPWSIGCGDPNPSKRGEDAALMSDLPPEPSVKPAVSNGAGIEEKLPNFVPRALSTYLSRRISRVYILWIRQRPMPLFLLK
jgi:hypothetical protein